MCCKTTTHVTKQNVLVIVRYYPRKPDCPLHFNKFYLCAKPPLRPCLRSFRPLHPPSTQYVNHWGTSFTLSIIIMRSFLTISFSTIAYLGCSKLTLAFPNSTSEQPCTEILTTAPTLDSQQCSAVSITPKDQKDISNSNLRPCHEASAQIVWSADCADTGQNKVTGSILSGMDALYFISGDTLCAKNGRVSFWLARLTPQQITTLKEDTQSVRIIVPNVPFEYVDNRKSFGSGMAPATGETNSFKKRDLRVIKQDPADVSLSFLSTTLEGPIAQTYSYFSQGGRGTRVYVLCGGMDPTVDDLPDAEIDSIFAGQVKQDQSDIHPGGMGTCMGSKIVGSIFGVAKFATLVAVKYDPSVGGFIDALDKLVEDLMRWTISGYVVRGKAVVSINGGYPYARPGDPTAERIRELINELVKAYQLVVVVSAGFDPKNDYAEISDWPAALSPFYDIITVGAVDPRSGQILWTKNEMVKRWGNSYHERAWRGSMFNTPHFPRT